jgi:hypothetical protein
MLPKLHPLPQSDKPLLKKPFLIGLITLSLLGVLTLPQLAKADILDTLGGTLEQTIGSKIQNGADGAIGNIGSTIEGKIGGVFGGIGNFGGGIGQAIIGPIEQQIFGYINAFEGYFQKHIGDLIGNIFGHDGGGKGDGDGVGDAPTTTGALGIPDFDQDHQSIEQQIEANAQAGFPEATQQSDEFNHNPVALAQSLDFEHDRVESKGLAGSVLDQDGQQAAQQDIQTITQAQQDIAAKDQSAQGMDVTQDVMKNAITVADDESQISTGIYAQLMMSRIQQSADSLVEANISEAADESNRTHHAETLAGAFGVMSGGANLYLPGTNGKANN